MNSTSHTHSTGNQSPIEHQVMDSLDVTSDSQLSNVTTTTNPTPSKSNLSRYRQLTNAFSSGTRTLLSSGFVQTATLGAALTANASAFTKLCENANDYGYVAPEDIHPTPIALRAGAALLLVALANICDKRPNPIDAKISEAITYGITLATVINTAYLFNILISDNETGFMCPIAPPEDL